MQKRTKTFFSLFFILILISLLVSFIIVVFAQDEYGNQLTYEEIKQNGHYVSSFSNATYSEDMNITISNYLWDVIKFGTTTLVNTTVIGEGGYVDEYQGVGIQVFDENLNLVYSGGMISNPYILPSEIDEFENIQWNIYLYEINIYKTINYINITLWHNYEMTGNYSDYELTESWKFNLVSENYGEEEEEEPMFLDIYFLMFVLCLFVCPLSIVGTIKMRKPKLLKITAFSFIGVIIFFYLIMNINPFGG